MLGRQGSLDLVRLHVQKENNIKHMIAVGAVINLGASLATPRKKAEVEKKP